MHFVNAHVIALWIDNENTNAYFLTDDGTNTWYHISSSSPGSWPAMTVVTAAYANGHYTYFKANGNDVIQFGAF